MAEGINGVEGDQTVAADRAEPVLVERIAFDERRPAGPAVKFSAQRLRKGETRLANGDAGNVG